MLQSWVAVGFAPWRVRPHIDSTSREVVKIQLSLSENKRQHCAHDETKPHKDVYFLFFNPLKATGELEIESLGCHRVKPVSCQSWTK